MIENAYYSINPPTGQALEQKTKSPIEEYVNKLLYVDLCKSKTEKVLKQLRKINWDDPEQAEMVINCLTSVWEIKYPDIRYVASVVSGLSVYYDWIGVRISDWVLEDVRMCMEICDPKFNQRRVSVVKFLGELYNYKLLDSNLVVKVLYSLITFPTVHAASNPENLDLREDVFRIKLVCILLSTCGSYIKGNRRKIDYFLRYFQASQRCERFYKPSVLKHSLLAYEKSALLTLRATNRCPPDSSGVRNISRSKLSGFLLVPPL